MQMKTEEALTLLDCLRALQEVTGIFPVPYSTAKTLLDGLAASTGGGLGRRGPAGRCTFGEGAALTLPRKKGKTPAMFSLAALANIAQHLPPTKPKKGRRSNEDQRINGPVPLS